MRLALKTSEQKFADLNPARGQFPSELKPYQPSVPFLGPRKQCRLRSDAAEHGV